MPSIDVTDLLSDPDIAGQTFTVLRTATSVLGGITQTAPTTIPNVTGSVQPASSQELERMPDMERTNGAITVRSVYRLSAGDATHTADVVTFAGTQYTVESVQDFSAFGAGYVEALCSKLDLR